jgi:hypothetical protein
MAKLLPDDFREFLKLCNRQKVKYLLIGGYAVGHYGYPRATADMGLWVERSADNAGRLVNVLQAFGFGVAELSADLFVEKGRIVRLGVPPLRLEILNEISGIRFDQCYPRWARAMMDRIKVNVIGLADLKKNKAASGRDKDLDDLQHLP